VIFIIKFKAGLVCLATPYLCDLVGLDNLPKATGKKQILKFLYSSLKLFRVYFR